MVPRSALPTLHSLAEGYPILVVTGPRQSGKTTLVQAAFPDKAYVSLENPDERAFAVEDPKGFLTRFPAAPSSTRPSTARPFSLICSLVDRDKRMGLFVLTGSQQFGLLSGVTQSLAGRAGVLQLLPLLLARQLNLGTEVDLIVEEGGAVRPIEIKSSRTMTPELFAGLMKWLKYADRRRHAGLCRRRVLYALRDRGEILA